MYPHPNRRAVLAWASAGCLPQTVGAQAVASTVEADSVVSLVVDGMLRRALIHAPAQPAAHPMPLVVVLHGGGGNAESMANATGWARKAAAENFITVFPQGLARDPSRPARFRGNPPVWNDGSGRFYGERTGPSDVHFMASLLDEMNSCYAVDTRRVFFTGFSNGASMAFRIGAELPGRVAAIAPLAGALWEAPQRLDPPVALLAMSGTEDPLNPIEGGMPRLSREAGHDAGLIVGGRAKPPLRLTMAHWSRAVGGTGEMISRIASGGVVSEQWSPGLGGTQVVLTLIEGHGHHWPGGEAEMPDAMAGPRSDRLNATDAIWRFFSTQPLR